MMETASEAAMDRQDITKIVVPVLLIGALALTIKAAPDLRRYMRIERM